MSTVPLVVLAVVLVVLGGLFAAVDSALNTVSAARAEELAKEGRPSARRLLGLLDDRPRYVNLTVLLRILCEITATVVLVGALLAVLDRTWALVVGAAVMVIVDYVVIGVSPRTLGRQHAYPIALAATGPLRILGVLLGPISRILISVGNAVTPGRGFRNGPFSNEIELRELVDLAQESGVVADEERRMIQSVFDFGDTTAREIMVPRPEMVWIEETKTAGQATSLAVRSGHSRIPVIGENVDDIRGVVYLKDLVQQTYYHRDGGRSVSVADVMRPAVFVPDSKRLDDLLADMQRDRNHMAVLVDEYGGIAGLVTIEDVIEEIVGEIADEYDTGEIPDVEELDDDTYRVSARLPVEDLGELFDIDIEDDEVDTVGGLLGYELGRVPLPGAEVRTHGLLLRGEGGPDVRGRVRVSTVFVQRATPEEEPTDTDTATTEEHA
ncbi:Hemolysin, contains CBS domains [Rhodococcus rhodochrous J3]|uniref:Hemolysin family protein n=2 Tax=Rhodococcus rhodochrous TaxID=1829 RepID=A0AA46WSB7_RHORH|nr:MULTISPECIES: hemolysin family protein [Rhodococcus]AYA26958.1 HlyC/CorC family transporter [Rhodococcus rhodochrous]MBF4477169.1 HlyC/CorC family transporter [Rhodococcus rhodochrous]MCB8909071.1 hemolysin family protein [Rhodococcus rhodochrous]MDC3726411.1 HlyC/CorC family transporter [Rhodococcus sp. Rp3]MDJ0398090.1 hemolysin family protein [Rhodococcus rhodochrous]